MINNFARNKIKEMADNTNRIGSLEIKIKKLIALYGDLDKENKKLKKEIEELKSVKVEDQNNADVKRGRGRPKKGTEQLTSVNFDDNKEMRKFINELVEELDKTITKLED